MNKVLITDDNPEICRLLRRIAEGMGYDALVVENPEDFEAAYLGFEPNLVVLDLQMPQVDGIEILRYLAKVGSDVAVIIMSGVQGRILESAERLAGSLGLTIAGVVPKPIDLEAFEQQLQHHYFASSSSNGPGRRISESDLASAIANDELFVTYQPIVSLGTIRVTGVEALVRWAHPVYGLVGPDDFIPLAEETGLIAPLTYWVLERAVAEMSGVRAGGRALDVSVNLSPRLLDNLDLPDRVDEILRKQSFSRDRLIFEVTESGAMEDPNRSMDILVRLCLKNIRLSIDDFGTGYSSLLQLFRLPYCEIKIDKSFVQESLAKEEAAVIVKSTVSLGKNLDLRVVAEGIENSETQDYMAELGCDVAQGYLFCKPVSAEDLSAWLVAAGNDSGGDGGAGEDDSESPTVVRRDSGLNAGVAY